MTKRTWFSFVLVGQAQRLASAFRNTARFTPSVVHSYEYLDHLSPTKINFSILPPIKLALSYLMRIF